MKIYITRHGETNWNKEGRMQGTKNSLLTAKGVEDAKKLRRRLEPIEFSRIYASPLGRAMETAEILKGDRQIPIEKVPLFMEMNFGEWEGKTKEELERRYEKEYYNFWNLPESYQSSYGETYRDVIKRVDKGLREITANAAENETALLVTHAVVIKSIYHIIKGLPVNKFWDPPFMYGTNLTVLQVKGIRRTFLLEGDISHLQR